MSAPCRFTPDNDHPALVLQCPLGAKADIHRPFGMCSAILEQLTVDVVFELINHEFLVTNYAFYKIAD